MRLRYVTIAALLLVSLAILSAACGGGKKNNGSGKADTFPTATLPSTLPAPLIVNGTPQAPSGGNGHRYTVKEGDSPSSIAEQFNVSVDDLMSINHITDPSALHVGDVLTIPGGASTPAGTSATSTPRPQQSQPTSTPRPAATSTGGQTYTVRDGDIPETIAAQFGITPEELMAANNITDPTSLQVGQVLVIPTPSQ